MKNKLRYFVVTVILMMASILPSKAMVVFDANTDQISGKNSITKDGITVTRTDGQNWSYGFQGELSITSSDKNIVMLAFTPGEWHGASNSFQYAEENQTNKQKRHQRLQSQNHYSNSIESLYYDNFWLYSIWEGNESQINQKITVT